MLLVSRQIHMQKIANTCYMQMQEIFNTCMSNKFQILCVLSSGGSALQPHRFSLWPMVFESHIRYLSQASGI